MKITLEHLPLSKRREIEHIKTVLMTEFDKAVAGGTQPWRKAGKILKIILFGSFGRGDWVDDRVSGCKSDWDLLIVVNHEKLKPIEDFWYVAEDRLLRDPKVRRPFNLIVHTLQEVNYALSRGEYFWVDIVRDGAMLYEPPCHPLASPQPLSPADAYEMAREYFEEKVDSLEQWFRFVEVSREEMANRSTWAKKAAFSLHQAVETAYACFLLVRTLYLPRSHNVKFLRSLSEDVDRRLVPAWPHATKKDTGRFELLKRAYVEARYSKHYEIDAEDLDLLTAGARQLQALVETTCRERLEELRAASE